MTPPKPNYVLIDTPELKALFAPKRDGDEVFTDMTWLQSENANEFSLRLTYRRLARNAWLKISERPVQYPAWILHQNGLCKWFARDPNNDVTKMCWTHWLPAPNPPEAPRDEDDDAFMEFLRSQGKYGEILTAALAKQFWQAGRDYERTKK